MKIGKFILGLFLLPLYPFFRKRMTTGEKYQVGENVVVVTETLEGKKKQIQ